MNLTQEEYNEMTKKASPPSPAAKNITMAFLIGGLICAVGQVLIFAYQNAGMDSELAAGAASITLVFLSVLLT